VIIEIDSGSDATPGQDRRRAIALGFALCLALGSSVIGRDDPVSTKGLALPSVESESLTVTIFNRAGTRVATAPAEGLSLPPNTADALLSFIPERLVNEALPPFQFVPVRVRAVPGLAVDAARPGGYRMVTWVEQGNMYWLVSDKRDIPDLLQLADSLR